MDWARFGGLIAQLAHLGKWPAIATTDNSPTAMAYGKAVRAAIGGIRVGGSLTNDAIN